MSDPRLFKATRRTIRAELTLIVVIVISFSWSAYALYKLALGSSDSFFDFGFTQSKPNNQDTSQLNQSKPTDGVVHLEARNLTDQLAIYKSQILKELLERQRQLFSDEPKDRFQIAPETVDFKQSLVLNNQQADRVDKTTRPLNIEELERWRGGYKMPTTINYLLDKGNRNTQPFTNNLPADRIPSSSEDHAQRAVNSALVPLADAPSLMQLSRKFDPKDQQNSNAQTTQIREIKLLHDDPDYQEPSGDEARVQNEDAARGDFSITQSQSQTEATSTTTMPPGSYEQESLETTTLEPASTVADDETTPSPQDEAGEESDLAKNPEKSTDDGQATLDQANNEENKGSSSGNDDEPNDDDGSLERVKNTVHAIDEEVDRMTQPSVGMASQQDKSFDYKNTVQFDDSLPGSIQRELDHDIRTKVPRSNDSDFYSKDRHPARHQSDAGDDLQVADNRSKSPINVSHTVAPTRTWHKKVSRMKEPVLDSAPRSQLERKRSRNTDKSNPSIKRLKTSANHPQPRQRRSVETNLISKTLNSIEPKIHGKKKRKSSRRSDDQDDSDDSDQSESPEADEQEGQSGPELTDREETPEEKLRSSYQTITSNDPTLQELLAHKRLLDELQHSQVPAPVAGSRTPKILMEPQQQRLNSTFIEPSRHPQGLSLADTRNRHPDHQPADTQYTVDHGLLLYPAEDEEHHHKSMSKKSKKASHKKAKKKMTVAMKKGGHKKKKHKKEEKKYLKEKKFKGAKKGKKMSKGKGGKGGKKGKKYYKDKGFKKKGFKNIYVKNEFGQKKSYFDEFRDKDFKKKWKNFDDKYNYAQMKKWQAKDVKGAKKMKDQGENYKKYDKGKWKKKYHKHQQSESAKKKKKLDEF